MAEFFANKASYEGKAIVITDAEISPKVNNKYYLNNAVDSVYFHSNNVSSYAPAGGEMAGVYVGLQYDRFILLAPNFIKATKFYTFTDMSTYYKGRNYEVVDAEVGGAVLVNYVTKIDETTTAIFAQYLGLTGLLNNGIDHIWVFQNANNIARSEVWDTFIYKYGIPEWNYGYATAVGLMKSIVSLILLVLGNTVCKKLTGEGIY